MTVNIICDKDSILGIIGFETDEGTIRPADTLGLTDFHVTVPHEKLIELRDKLLEMFPVNENGDVIPEWRSDGEWREVTLEEAREGDYAEFDKDRTKDDGHVVCRVKKRYSAIVTDTDDTIVGSTSGYVWFIRNSDGSMGTCVKNLRIWRKLDPHRFDEPTEIGHYVTKSGKFIAFNDGGNSLGQNWRVQFDNGERSHWYYWQEMREELDDSEFPLIKLTPEMLRKVVQE